MGRNTKLINPVTGRFCFGVVPEIRSIGTERAPICLLKGFHVGGKAGQGSGFGEAHILEAHAKEVMVSGCASVGEYIARYVCPGVPVCSEGGYSRNERVIAMRHSGTIVVLEYRHGRDAPFWSIVTAYIRGRHLAAKQLAVIEDDLRNANDTLN